MTLLETILSDLKFVGSRARSIFTKNNCADSPELILYHGFVFNSFYMDDILNYLAKQEIPASASNYAFWKDMRGIAEKEAEKIARLCQKKGKKISLLGHSQGGLIATSIAQDYPYFIDKVITLGTPFQGTKMAYLQYPITSCRQMLSGSDYLKELNQKEFPKEVKFYNLIARHDYAIFPWQSAIHPAAENLIILDSGHASLIKKDWVIGEILKDNISSEK